MKQPERGTESPETYSVSCQLYQRQSTNDIETNQTQHDSHAASVSNQDVLDAGNLMHAQFS